MRKWEYIALGVILLLTVGRLLWFPVALLLVSGDSMLPTYRTGDLVLGVATYLVGYRVGDIVVWYATYTHGVIHRVISISDNYMITKGDNNPISDPPVPKEWVRYVVVLWIPREAWIPVALGLAGLYFYRSKSRNGERQKNEDDDIRLASVVLVVFSILNITVLFLVPVYWFSYGVVLLVPRVELRGFAMENFTTAVAEYTVYNAEIVSIESCRVLVGNITYPCGSVSVRNTTVVAGVPREAFYVSYDLSDTDIATIRMALNVTFDKGWVYGVYNYTFNWKPLRVEVVNRSVVVYNPNPIPFNLTNITVVYMGYDDLGRPVVIGEEALGNATVEPLSSIVIKPEPKGSYCYVRFTYSYRFTKEGYVYESRRIDFR